MFILGLQGVCFGHKYVTRNWVRLGDLGSVEGVLCLRWISTSILSLSTGAAAKGEPCGNGSGYTNGVED